MLCVSINVKLSTEPVSEQIDAKYLLLKSYLLIS